MGYGNPNGGKGITWMGEKRIRDDEEGTRKMK